MSARGERAFEAVVSWFVGAVAALFVLWLLVDLVFSLLATLGAATLLLAALGIFVAAVIIYMVRTLL